MDHRHHPRRRCSMVPRTTTCIDGPAPRTSRQALHLHQVQQTEHRLTASTLTRGQQCNNKGGPTNMEWHDITQTQTHTHAYRCATTPCSDWASRGGESVGVNTTKNNLLFSQWRLSTSALLCVLQRSTEAMEQGSKERTRTSDRTSGRERNGAQLNVHLDHSIKSNCCVATRRAGG